MNYLLCIGGFLLGYVFGSIPCGLWLVQAFHGIDIRNYGSGNIGTTNVFRTVGPKTAAAVLVGDMLKGVLALCIISKFTADPFVVAVTAIGALLGHNYSLFLGFKGGKLPDYKQIDCAVHCLQKHGKQHWQHKFQELWKNRSLCKVVFHFHTSTKKAGQNSRRFSLRSYPALHFYRMFCPPNQHKLLYHIST